jgi:PEP-CTERM motif
MACCNMGQVPETTGRTSVLERRSCLVAVGLLAIVVVMVAAPTARANSITNEDPATLFITSTGQFCQNGGACVVNNEANPLNPTSLMVFQNQGGSITLDNPVLLIVGIPGGTSGAPTGVTLASGGTGTLGGADYYGGTWNTATGFASSLFDSSSTQDVYEFLGMVQGNASESFSNWASASAAVGVTGVTDYGIAIYELFPSPGLSSKGIIDLTFSSALPTGSIVVAYGCSKPNIGNNPCAAHENPYTTPFTEAGDVTPGPPPPPPPPPVPEPGTLMMLGSGLLALGGIFRRRLTIGG